MKNIIKFKDVITTDEKKEIADKLEEEYRKTKDMPPEDDAADNDVELTPVIYYFASEGISDTSLFSLRM